MYNVHNVHATHRSRVLANETQSGPVPWSLLVIDTPTPLISELVLDLPRPICAGVYVLSQRSCRSRPELRSLSR